MAGRNWAPFRAQERREVPAVHPAVLMEERLAVQHQEIQTLLVDNQRLAATHVALKQELIASRQELQRAARLAADLQAEKDAHLREIVDRAARMEAELRSTDSMRTELSAVRSDVQRLGASKQELAAQANALKQDLGKALKEAEQAPALKTEIDAMQQELHRGRAAVEYEKKAHADNFGQSQAMEKNMITMAREVEKLRAELANAEKRARAAAAAAAAAANPVQVPGYGGNYVPMGYGGSSYGDGYHVVGAVPGSVETLPQYGSGMASHGSYDMQPPHLRR